ncbi:antibiotic biosynthesis monooxygenase [Fictibacillus terranigra]|uniref:Antibiotic biosynthesis monooxygenase n=1 Tax=Fictibacillus terranigra TaxID=3058424 RepID=A0ABT8E4M8_9BACL|nr:antibiotic biosynthesis monooxygenase [Fictibacillus sp. CENA-BCM004]MDN4072866.1 antibiotic biosynthesis monooxygenase [Fictibacillus sp. CENA-BCM004]
MREFKKFEEETNKEEGCIKFHAYPLVPTERKIILWVNLAKRRSVNIDFTKPHTKNVQKQKLTEVEWLIKSNV